MLGGRDGRRVTAVTRPERRPPRDGAGSPRDFVVADRIVKHFPVRVGAWRRGSVRSVDGVSFRIRRGEIMGLVGESGCGKSTLARVLLRLLPPDSGTVTIAGRDLSSLHGEDLRRFRTTMQLIFQNPYAALDPRMRIGTSLEAPLAQHGIGTHRERSRHAADMLGEVGLDESFVERLPRQCSGGELQRIVISSWGRRAITVRPASSRECARRVEHRVRHVAIERAESRFSAYHRAGTQGSCRRSRRRSSPNSAIRTAAGLRGTDGFVAGDPRQPHYRSEQ